MERLGKEILRACRALISELQLRADSWPDIMSIIQSVLNHNPSLQRNAIAHATAFTELSPSTRITTFMRSDKATLVSISQAQIERSVNTAELVIRMNELRPLVQDAVTEIRKRA